MTSEVRFGGRLGGGGGWRAVCTGLTHSHSLTGSEWVDGSGDLCFYQTAAGTISSSQRSSPSHMETWLEGEVPPPQPKHTPLIIPAVAPQKSH